LREFEEAGLVEQVAGVHHQLHPVGLAELDETVHHGEAGHLEQVGVLRVAFGDADQVGAEGDVAQLDLGVVTKVQAGWWRGSLPVSVGSSLSSVISAVVQVAPAVMLNTPRRYLPSRSTPSAL